VGILRIFLITLLIQVSVAHAQIISFGQPSFSNDVVQLQIAGPAEEWFWIESSPDLQNWQPVSTNQLDVAGTSQVTIPATSRKFYRAGFRKLTTPFPRLFTIKETIDLQGNNLSAASFDSSDSSDGTGGPYDYYKFRDGADIFAGDGITNFFETATATIFGKVSSQFLGAPIIGTNGSVGDRAWISSGTKGIKCQWFFNEAISYLPPVPVPFTNGFSPDHPFTTFSTRIRTQEFTTIWNSYPTSAPPPILTNGILVTTTNFPQSNYFRLETNLPTSDLAGCFLAPFQMVTNYTYYQITSYAS
jgi:hypothetical protein